MAPVSEPSHGIKLEFIAVVSGSVSPKQVRDRVADILSTPILGHCDIPGCVDDHTYCLDVSRNKYADNSWSIYKSQATRISADELEAAARSNLELSLCVLSVSSPGRKSGTPKYPWFAHKNKKPEHAAWFSSESEIRHVFGLLNSINEGAGKDGILAVYTNAACSLQVHVGTSVPSRGVALGLTKRLLQFFTLFERAIDSIQNSQRTRKGYMETLAFANIFAGRNLSWKELAELSKLLPTTQSHIGIHRLTLPRKARPNGTGVPSNRTIEFRQHAATLRVEEVLAWVDACEKIVAFVANAHSHFLSTYYSDTWYDLEYSLPRILTDAQAKPETIEHYLDVSDPDDHYEYLIYHDTIQNINDHPMFQLLQRSATDRYLNANRAAVGAAINLKTMNGDYGWLPSGSPYLFPGVKLPVFHQSDMYSYKVAAASHGQDYDEVQPGDSVSQVGARDSPQASQPYLRKIDSGLDLGNEEADGGEALKESVKIGYDESEGEVRVELPERRYSI